MKGFALLFGILLVYIGVTGRYYDFGNALAGKPYNLRPIGFVPLTDWWGKRYGFHTDVGGGGSSGMG